MEKKFTAHYVPDWLQPLLGTRENLILSDPKAEFRHEDEDGERLPNHQQLIVSREHGRFMIDAKLKKIIG